MVRTNGAQPQAMSVEQSFDQLGVSRNFAANEEIYGEGEPVEHFYKVMSGCVRTYNVLRNGRYLVDGFYLTGECFGFEASDKYSVCAEATCDSRVLVIDRMKLISRAACDINITSHLMSLAAVEMQCAKNRARRLTMLAEERVISFLSEIATRERRQSEINLPMSRQDIADYLGLTIETVSRMMTRLQKSSAISMSGYRRIVLHNIENHVRFGKEYKSKHATPECGAALGLSLRH